jgi:tetratricopeptide (TPR) repeat protein
MAGKKSKSTTRAQLSRNNFAQGISWKTVVAILGSIAVLIGAIVSGLDFIRYLQEGYQQFLWLALIVIVLIWLIFLWLLVKQRNIYGVLWLAVSLLVGTIIWNGWRSYDQTRKDKVIVLIAQFDGPEETFGIRRQIMEELWKATKAYEDTVIIEGEEVATSSAYARRLGEQTDADLVIWAWYRPTENPNITLHLENLSPSELSTLDESETYRPQASLADLDTFEIQSRLGSETSSLISFTTGYIHYNAGDYNTALERFNSILQADATSPFIPNIGLLYLVANCHSFLGNQAEAIRYYDQVILLRPDTPDAYFNRGIAHAESNHVEEAIQDYSQAIQLRPVYPDAYYNRAYIYDGIGEYELAI